MILSSAFLPVLFILVFRSSSRTQASPFTVDDPDVCNTPECQEAAQVLRDSMDTSVDPCQDFFQYACGGWLDKHPIPDDEVQYSTTDALIQLVSTRVAELLSATNESHVRPVLLTAALYQGCVDEDARDTQGLDPLKNFLNSIGGWPLINPHWSDAGYQWQEQVANIIRNVGSAAIVGFSVDADDRDSSRNVIALNQAAFGLGRTELLSLNATKSNVEDIEAYKDYIVETGKLLNPDIDENQLISDAEELIQFEASLAQISKPPEEKDDPEQMYNKMSVRNADRITENTYFKWKDFLNIVFQDYPEVTDETEIVVVDIDFLKNALKLVDATDIRTVANYIGWILVKELGPQTTREFRQNKFNFDSVVTGIVEPEDLESACSESVTESLGFAIGRLYVDKYFSEQEKLDIETILEDIRSAFELKINHNEWMDADTKRIALQKVRSMISMIAYPRWIKNDQELIDYYSSVPDLKQEEFFESVIKVSRFVVGKELKKWNEPTQRTTEWITSPSVVNAFYDPNANTISFPAGYINLPEYKHGRLIPLNYAGIGATIGHEMGHGFDQTGSQFDKEGNLVDWWSKDTKDHFDSKVTCFKRQYSSYVEPSTNMSLNGNLTIGDDIADNCGLRSAYLAYKIRALESDDQQPTSANKRLPGIDATPDQLFFIGFGSAYCWHQRTESLAYTIENSDHTVHKYRVIVPLSNFEDFAEAFNCPLGSPMNPESKCVLW